MALMVAAALCACSDKGKAGRELPGADPERGLALIVAKGCGACHTVPGVAWPQGVVGGTLDSFGERTLIAGRLPNQPDILVAWLQDPTHLAPDTAMPPSGLTRAQARDVAAYLYTLDDR